ncbi:MAG TPA: hypothetical protein VFU49_17240 [Ktedonobacteraceae bacterium]|nr:hypothetical protein [Ktedonobacteraceae bacterium]
MNRSMPCTSGARIRIPADLMIHPSPAFQRYDLVLDFLSPSRNYIQDYIIPPQGKREAPTQSPRPPLPLPFPSASHHHQKHHHRTGSVTVGRMLVGARGRV